MQPIAPTIPVRPRVVVMRVTTHSWTGAKHETPIWHILGYRDHYELNRRWFYLEDVTLGCQENGDYILDVTTLGLDPAECMTYLDAEERYNDLCMEEDRYDLHSDPDGECLCGQIAVQKAIMDLYESKIDSAVKEHFDAWTRRRHLVALGSALGMSSFDMPAWSARLGLQASAEPQEMAEVAPAIAVTEPYPVAAEWAF